MNYLAHLFLADVADEILVGSLLGDFVKGRLEGSYTPLIRQGIVLHRRTDSFTDTHPRVGTSRNRISPLRRRLAGIIVDLGYDHFLARHWDRYSKIPLAEFTAHAYAVLLRYQSVYPPRLRQMLPHMVEQDWLGGYGELSKLGQTFYGMSRRLRRPNHLAGAEAEISANYGALEQDFRTFFPDVCAFTTRELKRLAG